MNLNDQVLQSIMQHPGTPKSILAEMFGLSLYRLNRVFRHIERGLRGRTLVHEYGLGVWIVDADPSKCRGMVWMGDDQKGYRQCSNDGKFPDGRCYEHSECEAADMVAFQRRLSYLTGPGDLSVRGLSQLTLQMVHELLSNLEAIVPLTLKDLQNKGELFRLLTAASVALARKDRVHMRQTEPPIPPEFHARYTHYAVNPFEYSLKKYFTVLELPVDADRDQVLRAWKQLALRYHPDVQRSDGDEEKMKAINLAKDRIFRVKGWD